MAYIVHDCPICDADETSLQIVGRAKHPHTDRVWLQCRSCKGICSAHLRTDDKNFYHPQAGNGFDWATGPDFCLADQGWTVVETWPARRDIGTLEHLPDAVAKAYRSAERNFRQPDMEEAAAGSYGRALDIGTKIFAPELAGERVLGNRIAMMRKRGLITASLADWASLIKDIRNGALHDVESVSREELKAIRGFTETLLTYMFTLPGMLAERKAAAAAGLTEPPPGENEVAKAAG